MKTLHQLANAFLSEKNDTVANGLKNDALAILRGIKFTTLGKTKDALGLSYIGSINSSAKIEKNLKKNYYTYIVYLMPAKASGFETCPMRSEGCTKLCLNTSGRVKMDKNNSILTARLIKTWLFFSNREVFSQLVFKEIALAQAKAKKDGVLFSVRMNGTSDLNIETIKVDGVNVLTKFSDVQFYDYTKVMNRFEIAKKYKNYDLTFSYSGENLTESIEALKSGIRVAIPFLVKANASLPETFLGFEVGDADLDDLRFLDEKPIAGLRVKRTRDKAVEKEEFEKGDFVIDLSKAKWTTTTL